MSDEGEDCKDGSHDEENQNVNESGDGESENASDGENENASGIVAIPTELVAIWNVDENPTLTYYVKNKITIAAINRNARVYGKYFFKFI